MTQAKNGDSVTLHYTGKLSDGTIFDSSEGRDPLPCTLGSGQVIPGFDEVIIGNVANLSTMIARENVQSPALIVVGAVVKMAAEFGRLREKINTQQFTAAVSNNSNHEYLATSRCA